MKPPLVANIPGELKDRRQWVGWKYEQRGGKLTKIPKHPKTGENADGTDPATWASIQEALIAMEKYGFDGVGYVFAESDPFVGIDLDSCLDLDTGELAPWARRWVDHFKSYTEITPSGKGLHIIVKGRKPDGFKQSRKGKIEIYDRDRYFTFTGNLFDANGNQRMSD